MMTITRLYGDLTDLCLSIFDAGAPRQPVEIAERLMDCESVAMHCPEHHFIVPAALLTAARLAQGAPREALEKDLSLAAQRASKVAGGFCGSWGCCGAAVGCGIFAAVLTGSSPKKEADWAQVNQMTARCLENVASVGGPRCCKRDSFLSVLAAVDFVKEHFGLEMEKPDVVCTYASQNNQCIGKRCPFSPANH